MADLFASISNQIYKDVKNAANMTKQRAYITLQEGVADYDTTSPKYYKHTYELLNSPKTTPVSGSKKQMSFEVYMDEGISYHTGKYTGGEVISATEEGHSGTIGNHGYFRRFENEIPDILDECFGAFFNK